MWIEPSPVTVNQELRAALGGHPLVAEILARRGIVAPQAALAFLDPGRYTPSPPEELPDLSSAARRLEHAIERGERIAVWGDFDVDGQTATTILVSALRGLGADVVYYIPNRLTESHGIRIESLARVLAPAGGVRVLLTCDTGIAAHEAIAYAKQRGVPVLVTDHHDLPDELPEADALVNPMRLPPGHPLRQLPGVGVAYKLIQALDDMPERYLDLVALGIVADVAEQTGDTRYLLQLGLERLRRPERVGLRAMFETVRMDPARLSAEHIGFGLGPRLNALGRLGDANLAVELFTTNDWSRARILAAQLEGLNNQRRLLSEQIYAGAQEQIARDPALLDSSALVLENPHWHGGVIGPVAGRLAEQYTRPVVLIVTPPGPVGRGSARSVPGCNINAALSDPRVSQWLVGFGGHPGAAGLTIAPENIPAFRRALSQAVEMAWDRAAAPFGARVDAYVQLDELRIELAQELERLAPFGQGNPPIHLACRNLTVAHQRTFGRNGEHREVTAQDTAGNTRKLTWWRGADQELPTELFDLVCALKSTDYLGRPSLEIEWIDARRVEISAIELAPALEIEVMDWRGVADVKQRVVALVARGDAQVWIEGGAVEDLPGRGRHELAPAETLVVWSAPPGPRELGAALGAVSPRAVALCGVTSAEDRGGDRIEPFLRRLGGLLKHDLRQRQGQVYLPALAAACGQRLATVRKGIEWLTARGQIVVQIWEGDHLIIAPGNGEQQVTEELETELRVLLSETAAYRAYFGRAGARQLVGD